MNPWLATCIAVICVGWSAIFIRWAGEAHPVVIAFLRLAIAAAFWTPFHWRARRRTPDRPTRRQRRARALAGLFLGVHFILWISAFSYTTVASAVFLILTQPILSALAAHLFLEEKLNRWNGGAILLTVLGSWLICRGDLQLSAEYFFGDILALAGAVASTAYLLMARLARPARQGQLALSLARYLAPVYWIAALVCGLGVLVLGLPLVGPFEAATWWSLLALGLIPTVIGHSLFNYALGHLPAFSVNIALVGEPILSSLLAWWLLAETPAGSLWIGGAVLVAAVFFVLYKPPGDPLKEVLPE